MTMSVSETARISLSVSAVGLLAFVFGIIAENKKPKMGTAMPYKDVVVCKFPHDPTIVLGSLSVVFIFLSAILGIVSVYYPYKGRTVPATALFRGWSLFIFFSISVGCTFLALAMMMWATITEGLHISRNVHHNPDYTCPTAKTGLFGGAAFLALDAALFWLVCQMLTLNNRADYFEDEDPKGEYGQVTTAEYDLNPGHPQPKV